MMKKKGKKSKRSIYEKGEKKESDEKKGWVSRVRRMKRKGTFCHFLDRCRVKYEKQRRENCA